MSVDQLIKESVVEHLGRNSYNSAGHVTQLMQIVGVDVLIPSMDGTPIQDDLAAVWKMMTRRHQIVHRADIAVGDRHPSEINNDEVNGWLSATISLAMKVLFECQFVEYPKRRLEALRRE